MSKNITTGSWNDSRRVGRMTEISAISGIAGTTINKYVIENVYKAGDGKHKVVQNVYMVTTYDSNGQLTTTTNSHQINYLI